MVVTGVVFAVRMIVGGLVVGGLVVHGLVVHGLGLGRGGLCRDVRGLVLATVVRGLVMRRLGSVIVPGVLVDTRQRAANACPVGLCPSL